MLTKSPTRVAPPQYKRCRRWAPVIHSLLLVAIAFSAPAAAQDGANSPAIAQRAVLWTDPGDIKSRDLFYGPGGKEHVPQLPVRFAVEDSKGTNPKFDVIDSSGKKWRAKLDVEAQPETVASRLLWAVGYVANENYFFPDLVVDGLPPHLQRGQKFIKNGHVSKVRLQRHPEKEAKMAKGAANWDWRHNPFVGTREFNGLRVMMALISNWDVVNGNTALRQNRQGELLYEVSDVGASFGNTGMSYTAALSKNNLSAYQKAKFIAKVTPDYVDFNFPTHPPLIYVFNLPVFWNLVRPRWIGRHIPRNDVRWIASLLSQLSPQQIRDAFRAAGYTPDQVEGYATAVEARIGALSRL